MHYLWVTAGRTAEEEQADMGTAPQQEHPHADHAAGVTAVPMSDNAPPSLGASDASQGSSPRDPLEPSASSKGPATCENFMLLPFSLQ